MSGSLLTLLRELSRRGIEYVVVGGMAGVLQGAPVVTSDVDVVHRRTKKNVSKLLQLLEDIDAVVRDDDRQLRPGESHLMGRGHILLTTNLGPLDLLCEVREEGYEELLPHADKLNLGNGLETRVIRLAKLIEQKTAAGRDKDKMALPILRATLEEKERSE